MKHRIASALIASVALAHCGGGSTPPLTPAPPPEPTTPAPPIEDPDPTEGLDSVHPFLAVPADGHLIEMPVVIIKYIPLKDAETIDRDIIGNFHFADITSVDALEAHIEATALNTKYMLEEGSRFRGYWDSGALPMLGYRVIEEFTFFEPVPRGQEIPGAPGVFFPDWTAILERVGAREFVNREGVREFWIHQWHHGDIAPIESNMSSPTTSDISNSFRQDDLPVYDATYVVYAYNYTRMENENVHNHGHQLEAILSHANERQAGNADFFWKDFVGRLSAWPNEEWRTGRAGWTHMPPNTTAHYDYHNETVVESDIEDWTPDESGQRRSVSAETWRSLPYATPVPDPARRVGEDGGDPAETHWYIYWMQNMPGRDNRIRHADGYLTNWWWFKGDWDAAIRSGQGLWGDRPSRECRYELGDALHFFGPEGGEDSVALTAPGSCGWEAATADEWLRVAEADAEGTGNGRITINVAENTGPRRAGAIVVGGRALVVVQEPPASLHRGRVCSYTISRDEVFFGVEGGVERIEVVASRPGCRWEAHSPVSWVRLGTGPIWRGNAEVAISAAPLVPGEAREGSRSSTLELAGQQVRVYQQP